jgi:hypothetical protein
MYIYYKPLNLSGFHKVNIPESTDLKAIVRSVTAQKRAVVHPSVLAYYLRTRSY